ncbi:MAG: hypothetical protein J6O41_06350, partial [Clostridia bacterium]|nr:hypothetical protein [Clostridia bacterium]
DSCNGGNYLSSSNSCEVCTSPCKTCSNENTCISCIDGYFKLSDKCYECNINCKTSNDNCKCDNCDDGYYLINYQCLKCDSNCKTCTGSASQCTSCSDGYYNSNNQCLKCDSICKTCSDSANKCDSCNDGYYLSNNQCLKCNSNCKTCSENTDKCDSCNGGNYLSSSNSCEVCTSPCKTCSNENTCISCIDGYFILSDKCLQCNINCNTTIDNCRCNSCYDGYYLSNFQCFSCKPNCKTCPGSADICLQCNKGYFLNFNNSCEKCSNLCDVCSDENTCITCESGYVLNDNYCIDKCPRDNSFKLISSQKCVKSCSIQDLQSNLCILNYTYNQNQNETNDNKENIDEDLKTKEILLQNVEELLISDDYNTSSLDNGEDVVIIDEKMTVTLTTTESQKNNTNNNVTIINLGECEALLRHEYNISDNENLYIKKIDLIQEGMKIPKVGYDIYAKLNGTNLVRLNLTVCEKSEIFLSVPVIISESLDKLDSNSGYYTDICYTATSDSGTDISLKDRKKDFIEGNKAICQDDCQFQDYDYTNQKANCSCKVKESMTSILDLKINKTKLYENFVDIKNIANIKMLSCYKVLLTKDGLKKNIASFCILPILLFHLIAIFIFYFKQKKKIDKK